MRAAEECSGLASEISDRKNFRAGNPILLAANPAQSLASPCCKQVAFRRDISHSLSQSPQLA